MTANSGGVRPPVRGPDGETAVALPVRLHWRVLAWLTLVVDVLLVGLPFPILMFAQASGLSALASIAFPMLVWVRSWLPSSRWSPCGWCPRRARP